MKGRKGRIAIVLGLLGALALAFAFTGCEHEHVYKQETVAANCGVAGKTTYTCEECGHSYTQDIPATGAHKHTPQLYSNATHHWYFCEVCYQYIEETAHVWDEGVITAPATMIETGIKTYTCITCDKEKQEEIPMLPHTHNYSTEWLSDATQHWRSCSICANEQEKQDHDWDNGVVTTPATTVAVGYKTYTCMTCEKKKQEEIPIIPHEHNYQTVWSGDEVEHWQACASCNEVQNKGGHTWGEELITLPATSTSTGLKQSSCTVCQRVKVEEIPMLPASNSPTYALTNNLGAYMVTGFDGMAAQITIPATYNGLRVIGIAKKAFYQNPYVKKITLPNTIKTIEESAFEECTSLTSVNIPESVTTIGWKAFKGCTALSSVSFDVEIEGVATSNLVIDNEAFKGCINLASVALAENTKSIGVSAFENCFSLKSVAFNERLLSIGNSAFANCQVLDGVVFNQALQTIGALAFDNCISLTKIELPDSVISVGAGAFRCAEKLAEVTLSENMTAIENATFQYCKALKEIIICENVKAIGVSAFSCCENLKDVRILGDISTFGDHAFYRCERLESIYFNSSTKVTLYNEHYIFYDAGIKGNGITLTISEKGYIPHGLFEAIHNENAPKLTEIIVEEGATEINYFTTYNYLPYVTEISLPESVVTIGYNVFSGCTEVPFTEYEGAYYLPCQGNEYHFLIRMKEQPPQPVEEGEWFEMVEIALHEDARVVAYGLLSGWYNVEKLTLPLVGSSKGGTENTHFGYIFGAPAYTVNGEFVPSQLKEVVVMSAEQIDEFAFYGCTNIERMTLPFVGASESATGYQAVFGYIFGCETRNSPSAISGATYQYYSGDYYGYYHYYIPASLKEVTVTGGSIGRNAFYNCSNLASVEIGDSVTTIGNSAFYNCSSLASVEIGDSVTTIGNSAFEYCSSLTSVEIGDSVTSIGSSAFEYCSSLTSVVIPDSVTSIGDRAFYNCSSLTSVVIGDSVTTIGSSAFQDCSSLASVEIGDSVTSIGSSAFRYCSSLTSVYIPTSVNRIGSYAFYGCSSLTSLSFGSAYYTWYITSYSSYQYGSSISLTNSSTNATYFTSNYYSYYWYR